MDAFLIVLTKVGPASLGWALAATFVYLFMRGHLIPSSTVATMRDQADKRAQDKEQEAARWHTAFVERAAAMDGLTRQNGELLEVARTARTLMASLPPMPSEGGRHP